MVELWGDPGTDLRLSFLERGRVLGGHTDAVNWGAWGEVDGTPVLATGCKNSVRLWDPATGRARGPDRPLHSGVVWWGTWAASQPLLATGGDDGTVLLWNMATRSRPAELRGHARTVWWGAWGYLDDEPILATGDNKGTVRLWDTNGNRFGGELPRHAGPVRWGAWGYIDDQPILATGGDDGTVKLWDAIRRTRHKPDLTGHMGALSWGAWDYRGGTPVLATGGDRTVRLFNLDSGAPYRQQPRLAHGGPVWWGAWGRVGDEPTLATGGSDGTVLLWRPDQEDPLEPPLAMHSKPVLWGAWCQLDDRSALATGGDDGAIWLWDPATCAPLGQASGADHFPASWGVWGPVNNNPTLAIGGEGGFVHLLGLAQERVPRVTHRYSSDVGRLTELSGRPDLLDRQTDLSALADVITAKSAKPPLAIGLFGQWGDGKTRFLEMLERRVQQRAQSAKPNDPIAHNYVRQVSFNAWHYAEADLWASLVAELFAQLSSPPKRSDVAQDYRQRSRLASELVAGRRMREQLVAAEDRLAALERAAEARTLPKPTLDRLQRLLGEKLAKRVERNVATVPRSPRAIYRATPMYIIWGAIITGGIAGGYVGGLFSWGTHLLRLFVTVPASAAAIGAIVSIQHVWQSARSIRKKLGDNLMRVQKIIDEQALRLETARAVAAEEVEELQKRLQNQTAAGQLAGLVDERANASSYRQRLGLMTQIRQDFEHMAHLLDEAAKEKPRSEVAGADIAGPDAAGDELPRIDRIVIYIDDLDRCPPSRVVEVLEAIHLLLAVQLFVVVVAVDPRWLLRSLSSHYQQHFMGSNDLGHGSKTAEGPIADADEEERWASTPAQYLEKIFQIVLTLAPMETVSYDRMINDLLGLRKTADQQPDMPEGLDSQSPPSSEAPPPSPARTQPSVNAQRTPSRKLQASASEWSFDSLPLIERVDPLALTSDEHRLISLLGPPLITSPRAVKRLANSYGLLIATCNSLHKPDTVRADLQSIADIGQPAYPYRARMVLLAAVIGFPMLGPKLFPGLWNAARSDPDQPWMKFLEGLRPTRKNPRANLLERDMTRARAQHWTAFVETLVHITDRAADEGLWLPQRLGIWAEWIIPVGRLSFPTGSVVTRLIGVAP